MRECVCVCVCVCVCFHKHIYTLFFLSGPLTFNPVSVLMLIVADLFSDNERWLHAMCTAVNAPNRCPLVLATFGSWLPAQFHSELL